MHVPSSYIKEEIWLAINFRIQIIIFLAHPRKVSTLNCAKDIHKWNVYSVTGSVIGWFFFSVSMDTCVNTAGSTKSGTSRVTMKPGNGESADHEIRHIEIIVVKITSEETKTFWLWPYLMKVISRGGSCALNWISTILLW